MIYYTSLGCFFPSFFFFSIFFISALPTRTTTLFPLPSVECVREYRHRTRSLDTCFCLFFFFFFFSPPLSCRCCLLGMQEGDRSRAAKSYTDENWGCFLFVSSAIPCCPPSHFSSGVTPPHPRYPGAVSTHAIRQGHANFVIGKWPAKPSMHWLWHCLGKKYVFSDPGKRPN